MHYITDLLHSIDLSLLNDIIIRLISVLLCLTIHETSHGLAAWYLGDSTARLEKRISLNPLHHIDWLGLASLLIAGIGWAKPVPVDTRYFKHKKFGMAFTAFAGPLSNFILATICVVLLRYLPQSLSFIYQLLLKTCIMSIGLGVFNLIPIPPLDGSKIFAVIIPDKYYNFLMRYERYGMFILFAVIYLGSLNSFISKCIQSIFYFLVNIFF